MKDTFAIHADKIIEAYHVVRLNVAKKKLRWKRR